MGIALAPPIAGGGHPHQPRVEPVLHITFEDPVLDQDVLLRRGAFIVDRERAAPLVDAAVIDHRHARRANPLANPARKSTGALAVEITFEPVANRLVEQDPRPAGPQQHGHLTGWRIDTLQIGERLRQGLIDRAVPGFGREQIVIKPPPADPEAAGFAPPIGLRHDADVQPHQGANVAGGEAIGAENFNCRPIGREAARNLRHARIARAGGGIDRLEQFDLFGKAQRVERRGVSVEVAVVLARRRGWLGFCRIEQLQRLAGAADRCFADLIGMGKAGHFPRNPAQAKPGIARIVGGFEPPVVEHERL